MIVTANTTRTEEFDDGEICSTEIDVNASTMADEFTEMAARTPVMTTTRAGVITPINLMWVTVYDISRHYGGPSGGGWYWNYIRATESVLTAGGKDTARVVAELRRQNEHWLKIDYTSARCQTAAFIAVTRTPGCRENHYAGSNY